MIKDAIEYIRELADAARSSRFIRRPGDPPHIIHRKTGDGLFIQQEVEPGYRMLIVQSLSDLLAMAKGHFDSDIQTTNRMAVTYNEKAVQLVFDHKTGRERATFSLVRTVEALFFHDRLTQPSIDPKELYKALKYELFDTFNDSKLLDQVGNINFTDRNEASTGSSRGRESMGSSVEQLATPIQSLPDERLVFNVRYYANPELPVRFPLTCFIDPDPASRRWLLKPIFQSWDDLRATVVSHIGAIITESLKDSGVRVYEGVYEQDTADFTDAD